MSGISSYSSLFRVFQLHVGSETLFACKMPSSAHCNLDMVTMTRHEKLSRSLLRILCCCNFASKSRTSVNCRSWLMQNVCDIILANRFYGTSCLWNVHHRWQLIPVFSFTESLSLPDNFKQQGAIHQLRKSSGYAEFIDIPVSHHRKSRLPRRMVMFLSRLTDDFPKPHLAISI